MKTKFDFFGKAALVLTFAVAARIRFRFILELTLHHLIMKSWIHRLNQERILLDFMCSMKATLAATRLSWTFSISALRLISGISILTTIRMS